MGGAKVAGVRLDMCMRGGGGMEGDKQEGSKGGKRGGVQGDQGRCEYGQHSGLL